MRFDEILSNCIDAINQGETVESCLLRYPEHAAELSSLLQLIASMPKRTQLHLSPQAFTQKRTLLMSAARAAQHRQAPSSHSPGLTYRQSHHANHSSKFTDPYHTPSTEQRPDLRTDSVHKNGRPVFSDNGDLKNGEVYSSPHLSPAILQRKRQTQPALFRFRRNPSQRHTESPTTVRSEQRTPPRHWRIQTLLTMLVLVLTVAGSVVLYQATVSLPSSTLYGLKTLGRQAEGFLMVAAGDGATWHAEQMFAALDEFSRLEQQNLSMPERNEQAATSVELVQYHAQQALVAGLALSQEEQVTFYSTWLAQLETAVTKLDTSHTQGEIVATLLQDTIIQVNLSLIAVTQTPTAESVTPTSPLEPDVTDTAAPDNESIILIGTNTPRVLRITAVATNTPPLSVIAIESTATPVLLATAHPVNTLPVSPTEAQPLIPLATVMPTSVQIFHQGLPKDAMTIGQEEPSEKRSSDETSPANEQRDDNGQSEDGKQGETTGKNDSVDEDDSAEVSEGDDSIDDTNDEVLTEPIVDNGTIPQVVQESTPEFLPESTVSAEGISQATATPDLVEPSIVTPNGTPAMSTPLPQQNETLTPSATELVSTPDVAIEPEEPTVVETPVPTTLTSDAPKDKSATRVTAEPTVATEDEISVTPESTAEDSRSERQSERQSERRRRPSQSKIIDESTPIPHTPQPQATSQSVATSTVSIDSDEGNEP